MHGLVAYKRFSKLNLLYFFTLNALLNTSKICSILAFGTEIFTDNCGHRRLNRNNATYILSDMVYRPKRIFKQKIYFEILSRQ